MPKAQKVALGREYETIYVLRPDITSDGAKNLSGRVREIVDTNGAQLTSFESWGRRQMAYPVKRHRHGVYVYLKYVGDGGVVSELERNLRLLDDVIKYQTVKLRDEVDRAGIQVDPAQVALDSLELTPYEYEEESKEQVLGLADSGPTPGSREPSPESDREAREVPSGELDEDEASAKETSAKETSAKETSAKETSAKETSEEEEEEAEE